MKKGGEKIFFEFVNGRHPCVCILYNELWHYTILASRLGRYVK